MNDQNYKGNLCRLAKSCPVFQGELIVEQISPFLLKNVFCSRGFMGWKNCERYKLAKAGIEIPEGTTPYSINVEILS